MEVVTTDLKAIISTLIKITNSEQIQDIINTLAQDINSQKIEENSIEKNEKYNEKDDILCNINYINDCNEK